jgi:hypothetical protein
VKSIAANLTLLLFLAAPAVVAGEKTDPAPQAGKDPKPAATNPQGKKPAQKPDPKLEARIKALIRQLGHEEYDKREEAEKALTKIGRPALPQLKAAREDKDAERATRATVLCKKIGSLPDPSKVDPKCTNGWMAAYGEYRQVQSFKAEADAEVDLLRFRAARGYNVPGDLSIELRAADAEKDAEPLGKASFSYEWTGKAGKTTGVTRTMRWIEAKIKVKLEKGKTYHLVFSSPDSGKSNPWLINCFYGDTFKAGKHLRSDGEKAETLGKYDLVFQLCSKDAVKLSSLPDGTDLSKKEPFGLGHDGTDMNKAKTDGAGGFLPGLL